MGRTTTKRMATASTAAAVTMVRIAIMICRLRCISTWASTGSIDVATRTTARTLWSVPWHPWHRSWLAIGWLRTNSVTPSRVSSASCVRSVSTARWNSGPVIVRPGSRRIFSMEATTSLGSSASFDTSRKVARSVKASTPFRR